MAEFIFLDHSGFAVRTDEGRMVFDYFHDEPCGGTLAQGVVAPADFFAGDSAVFVSHGHADHFNARIFDWRTQCPGLRYFLADCVQTQEEAVRMGPGECCTQGAFRVRTLSSTDEGVAFLVTCGGKTIYHAGDLNWWDWAEDSEENRAEMKRAYLSQIEQLRGIRVDVAFVPVDPRLGDSYALGLDSLMRTAEVARAVPMHFWGKYGIFDRLESDPLTAPYRSRLVKLTHRGQRGIF